MAFGSSRIIADIFIGVASRLDRRCDFILQLTVFLKIYFKLCAYMWVCVCVEYEGEQRPETLFPLELESQAVVSCRGCWGQNSGL